MNIKEQYKDCNIHQPITSKVINVNSIAPIEYEHYYNNGYQHLFENVAPVKTEEALPPVEETITENEQVPTSDTENTSN